MEFPPNDRFQAEQYSNISYLIRSSDRLNSRIV